MKVIKIKSLVVSIASTGFIVLATAQTAISAQIGISAIGANAIVEGFEGLSTGSNVYLDDNIFTPGINSPYTFSSGVTLTDPIPNPPFSGGVIVVDFSLGEDTLFGLGDNGNVDNTSKVPGGTAFLASGSTNGSFSLTFSSPVFQVGGIVDSASDKITLSAFDTFGNLLETVSVGSVPVANWSNNFLGIQNTAGISKVTFSAPFLVLDSLTFNNSPTAVPEPSSTLGSIIFGVMVAWTKFRGNRR